MGGDRENVAAAARRLNRLSPREREVVFLVGVCMSYRDVAATLGISKETVRDHVAAVRRKLNLGPGRPKELIIRFYHSYFEFLQG